MAEFGVTTIPGRAKGFVVYTSNEVEYVVTRLLPIMLKNLPIILFYYSAANWYYSKKTRPLFQQFCKVFTHYSSNFPDQHIHSKETSKFMHYIVT